MKNFVLGFVCLVIVLISIAATNGVSLRPTKQQVVYQGKLDINSKEFLETNFKKGFKVTSLSSSCTPNYCYALIVMEK